MTKSRNLIVLGLTVLLLAACGGGEETTNTGPKNTGPGEGSYDPKPSVGPHGVGPIKEITFGELDAAMAEKGKENFELYCVACHKIDTKHVGPALSGVLERRNPAWVMNMILNPEEMVANDPIAKELFAEYLSPMANQNLTEDQARSIVEYIREHDQMQ